MAISVRAEDGSKSVSVEARAYQELKAVILRSEAIGVDQGALILTLGYADNSNARRVLVEIADHYLGSAVSEAVVAAVSLQGLKIVGDIDQAMDRQSTCVAKEGTRCLSEVDRNSFLLRLKDIAAAGQHVEYVW